MPQLTVQEQATNALTWEHINLVQQYLASVQHELARRAFTHDRSKLYPPEVQEFTKYTAQLKETTYGSQEYKDTLALMRPAIDHHYAHNRHHPEFYTNGIEDMTLIDLIEMVVDWMAAAKRTRSGDIADSLEVNRARFGINPQLMQIITNTALTLVNHYENLGFQDTL